MDHVLWYPYGSEAEASNKLGELRENQAQADYVKLGELIHPDITGYLIILLRINSNRTT